MDRGDGRVSVHGVAKDSDTTNEVEFYFLGLYATCVYIFWLSVGSNIWPTLIGLFSYYGILISLHILDTPLMRYMHHTYFIPLYNMSFHSLIVCF